MTTSKALIFDIKKFAIHDGTGIRTTVFFKGCPLRCIWCQNPEGLSINRRPIYFKNQCIHCRRCISFSKENEIQYINDRPHFNLNYKDFNHIIDACPTNAIKYDSDYYTIQSLIKVIKEDKVFFRDNGGVTFSGGEPFLQGEFLIEILKECKKENISTAIETTLFTSLELIQQALPLLDIIYIDLKLFDESKHIQYTKQSNQIIKEHIEYILKSKHKDKVIIRTPLIPNITATKENLYDIASFISNIYPEVKYELLNYNPLASSKYELVDLEYGIKENYQKFSKETMQYYYDIVLNAGIKNLIIE